MIRATRRAGRTAECALFAICLWSAYIPAARAQSACDRPAIIDYIADFGGSRTPPPAAWQACGDSLRLDPSGDYKAQVLRSFAALRPRTGIAHDPIDAEKKLFQGSERIVITRSFLDSWRRNLGVREQDQRFDSTFYRALLGSLAWIVIDRSGRLQESCVGPLERLRSALGAEPNWSAAETALLFFRDIPLWLSPGQMGVTLTGLRNQASGLSQSDLRIACDAIHVLATGSNYWPTVSGRLKQQAGTIVVNIPGDCAIGVCREARNWQKTPTPESWGSIRQSYSADLSDSRQRLDAARSALPGGTDWSVVETRVAGLRAHAEAIGGTKDPIGRDMVPEVERALAGLNSLTKLTEDLEDLVAYRKALGSLLKGDAARARATVKERSNWVRVPDLAAAYVAAGYWEKGDPGKSTACQQRGLHCSDRKVADALDRIAILLNLVDGALKP